MSPSHPPPLRAANMRFAKIRPPPKASAAPRCRAPPKILLEDIDEARAVQNACFQNHWRSCCRPAAEEKMFATAEISVAGGGRIRPPRAISSLFLQVDAECVAIVARLDASGQKIVCSLVILNFFLGDFFFVLGDVGMMLATAEFAEGFFDSSRSRCAGDEAA